MDESSFFSLDRLVEFGCGVAVATQMADAMNEGLARMRTPGADYPLGSTPTALYVVLDGRASGPFSEAELSRLIADKRLSVDTLVWKPGMSDWQRAETLPEVLRLVALTPPPVPVEDATISV